MKISVLQHADFEGPGEIAVWAAERGHSVTVHHLYLQQPLPAVESFDWLVVMGGEMNIYQYRDYPWLKPERKLISAAMQSGKRVVGICLGAQLIADALGARVVQNLEYELGWLPVTFEPVARALFTELPASATVLHWHGDTFELPVGAERLAESRACAEQGYFIPGKCLGLQFHLEVDSALARQMVTGSGDNWWKGTHVQSREEILQNVTSHQSENRRILFSLLDTFSLT